MKQRLKLKNFAFLLAAIISNCSFSQDQPNNLIELAKEIDGTYQMQVVNSRQLPTIHLNYMEIIESKRHETDTVYHYFNDNLRVMILSKSVISDPKFIKIPTTTR